MVVIFRLKKRMISAQRIPVDVSMDANVPPLPILYREKADHSDGLYDTQKMLLRPFSDMIFSPAWIMTMSEPDDTMAFNTNAMMFGTLGAILHYLFSVTVDVKDLI